MDTDVQSQGEGHANPSMIDVAGLTRRARRIADLSQRDLAALLGVGQPAVARWENGERVPDVAAFSAVLAVAGLSLQAVDEAGRMVDPLRWDAPYDRAGRALPAHLDVVDDRDPMTGDHVVRAPHRARRERVRERTRVVPADHPSVAELAALRAAQREARRLRLQENLRAARGRATR